MIQMPAINDAAFGYYDRLGRLKSFIEENYSDPLPLAAAADIVGLEKKYFSVFFQKKIGIGYRDWLSYIRVLKAIDMMAEKNYSITYIAYDVGFSNLRTFERAFKRVTGVTPRELKKQLRPA